MQYLSWLQRYKQWNKKEMEKAQAVFPSKQYIKIIKAIIYSHPLPVTQSQSILTLLFFLPHQAKSLSLSLSLSLCEMILSHHLNITLFFTYQYTSNIMRHYSRFHTTLVYTRITIFV